MASLNPIVLWVISFGIGMLLGVGFYLISLRGSGYGEPISRAPLSDDDKKLLEKISIIVDQKLVDRGATVKDIAQELSTSAVLIEKLFKRNFGEPFQLCLNRSRIEIAKERLRSSNSSESTIAEQCGFKNSAEMTRFFWRFFRTTPARYRMEQQVT